MKLSGPAWGWGSMPLSTEAWNTLQPGRRPGTPVPGVSAELAVRKLSIPRFPYYLAYLVTDDAIRDLAVAHERRRPGYGQPRTGP